MKRTLGADGFAKALNELNRCAFELSHSQSDKDRRGAVLLVSRLAELIGEDMGHADASLARYISYLRAIIPTKDASINAMAVEAIALMLATAPEPVRDKKITDELDLCYEVARRSDNDAALVVAVSQIEAIFRHSPFLVGNINVIDDALAHCEVWVRSPRLPVRLQAARSLHTLLAMVRETEQLNFDRLIWTSLLHGAFAELQAAGSKPFVVHGALLTIQQLARLRCSMVRGVFDSLVGHCVSALDHKEEFIRHTAMELIPDAARCCPEVFVKGHMVAWIERMLRVVDESRSDQRAAVVSIGAIAEVVGEQMLPFVVPICDALRALVAAKGGGSGGGECPDYILDTICALSAVGGAVFEQRGRRLLALLLRFDLSDRLIVSLGKVCARHPSLFYLLEDELIELIADAVHRQDSCLFAFQAIQSFRFTERILDGPIGTQLLQIVQMSTTPEDMVGCAAKSLTALLCSDSVPCGDDALRSCLLCLLTLTAKSADAHFADFIYQKLIGAVGLHKHIAHGQLLNLVAAPHASDDPCGPSHVTRIKLLAVLAVINPADLLVIFRRTCLSCISELEMDGPMVSTDRRLSSEVLLELLRFPHHHWIRPYCSTALQVCVESIRSAQLACDADSIIISCVQVVALIADIENEAVEGRLQEIFDMFADLLCESHGTKRQTAVVAAFASLLRLTDRSKLSADSLPRLIVTVLGQLKVELDVSVRMQLLDLFGVIGSIDPYRIKVFQMKHSPLNTAVPTDEADDNVLDDALAKRDSDYHSIAYYSLLKLLKDPMLAEYHMSCSQCITFIIREMGAQAHSLLDSYIACLEYILSTCHATLLEFYFQQIVAVVQSVGMFIKPLVPQIVSLVESRWSPDYPAAISMVSVLEALVNVMKSESADYMPRIVAILLCFHQHLIGQGSTSTAPTSPQLATSIHKLASAIATVAPLLCSYSVIVLRVVLVQLEHLTAEDPVSVKHSVLSAMLSILCYCDVKDQLAEVLRILARKWADGTLEGVSERVLDIFQIVHSIDPRLDLYCFLSPRHVSQLQANLDGDEVHRIAGKISSMHIGASAASGTGSLTGSYYDVSCEQNSGMNVTALKRAFDTALCNCKEAWLEWMRRLGIELLRESPVGSLRVCASLATSYFSLNKELFNPAFVACWEDMIEEEQKEIAAVIEQALQAPTAPAELSQALLDLAEYMEQRLEQSLPISSSALGGFAMKNHAYAKALYYREEEFKQSPTVDTLESLVSINSHIQNQDGAIGVLTYSQQKYGITLTESWYEKLQRWEDALLAYERRLSRDPSATDAILGILRCRFSLGDWHDLNCLAEQHWDSLRPHLCLSVAPLVCASSWAVNDFDGIARFVQVLPQDTADGCFFRAVIAVHQKRFGDAQRQIQATRHIVDTELTALIGESYSRAYISAIRVQMLSDLEDVIEYARCDSEVRKQRIKRSLSQRLMDCQENVEIWQRLLKIRNLVFTMDDDKELWIKFAQMAQEAQRGTLSRSIMHSLLHKDRLCLSDLDVAAVDPHITFACIQHCWHANDQLAARDALLRLANFLSLRIESQATELDSKLQRLVSHCFVTLGQWQQALNDSDGIEESVLQYYLQATSFDKTWYRSWHCWAIANYEAANMLHAGSKPDLGDFRHHRNSPYVVPAIQGFFRSIAIAPDLAFQDALRLLTLWFKYGTMPEVSAAIGDGFASVPVTNWLAVLPQLIARIHVPNAQVRRMIHSVLTEIGKHHPQALIYSLTVATKSQNVSRRTSAIALLDKIKSHSAVLVEEALLVSNELIRVAVLWEEMWYEGLEEASRMYFGEQNVPPMLAILDPLHNLLDRGPESPREHQFVRSYGGELREARELCKRYRKSGNMGDVTAAWELYYQVFRRINKAIPLMTSVDLDQASPKLAALHDISLAVPGTFSAGHPITSIARIATKLQIIPSKQRPRKASFLGSDGKWHKFLLKAHEDLRQDERVMQFFGLMNSLLYGDTETRKRHLDIQRYSVIPLSQNSGLIGWVTHCDTVHSLIKQYRESRGIQLSLEHRLMLQMAPDFDHLTRLQKVETFAWAMQNSDGDDLARIFWLKSKGAESWFERRVQFIRSVAVMSMTGYVLGLGDRHPSNLMIDRVTGRVVHIDFGDCFEVAMLREKFPEKVPFRLTRMMQKAFEASGVDGTFRIACEHTMRVMRENKESLVAILEAFIYDPLINWRLLSRDSSSVKRAPHQARPSFVRPSMAGTEAVSSAFPDDFSLAKLLSRDETDRLEDESINRSDNVHAGALNALTRVGSKLTGKDFRHSRPLSIPQQVDVLIKEATSIENLCQAYVGWCAFW